MRGSPQQGFEGCPAAARLMQLSQEEAGWQRRWLVPRHTCLPHCLLLSCSQASLPFHVSVSALSCSSEGRGLGSQVEGPAQQVLSWPGPFSTSTSPCGAPGEENEELTCAAATAGPAVPRQDMEGCLSQENAFTNKGF